MATPLWTPSSARRENSNLTRFGRFVTERYARTLPDYAAMHRWSVEEAAEFWSAIWDFCGVIAAEKGETVVEQGDTFPAQDSPAARWFPDARLNFAENLLRHHDKRTALVSILENGRRSTLTHAELYHRVAQLCRCSAGRGCGRGRPRGGFPAQHCRDGHRHAGHHQPRRGMDLVFSRLRAQRCTRPIRPDPARRYCLLPTGTTTTARPATAWSASRSSRERIDSLEQIVVIPLVAESPALDGIAGGVLFDDFLDRDAREVEFAHLPFDHPLYIMYSSGTTGVPKCIVHGAGGSLLQHLKEHRLQVDLSARGRVLLLHHLRLDDVELAGVGSCHRRHPGALRRLALCRQRQGTAGCNRCRGHQRLRHQRQVFRGAGKSRTCGRAAVTVSGQPAHDTVHGSPLSHESFDYIYREFKQDLCLSSISGGTDILSCFVGGCPVLPVYRGEIQAAGLGMAVEIWNDDGEPVRRGEG